MEQSISLKNFYDVYRVDPQDSGDTKHHLVARFMLSGDTLDVLADFHGYLGGFQDGPLSPARKRALESLMRSPYFRVVSRQDVRDGKHADLIPEAEFPTAGDPNGTVSQAQRPPSIFEYHHPMIGQPVVIESRDEGLHLNGHRLSQTEIHRIFENLRSGVAQIRYRHEQVPASVQKMEREFKRLMKIEPHLENALGQVRAAVKAGHLHPDVLKHLTGEIFTDPMVKGVGNKKAYADFTARPRQGGVHIMMDGNDFGQINKVHSFEHGNHAITAMGQAMREAMDEAVGSKHGKLFRVGGDEFRAFVPSHEHAARFARTLRSKMEKIPPVGGTHSLSVSMGFGHDADSADQASIKAKQAKKAMNYAPGQAKTHVHSLIPGAEGAVPVHEPTLTAPSADMREKPTGGAPTAPAAPVPEAPKSPELPKLQTQTA